MDKSTKIIINAGVGIVNLTNKIWKKKFTQLIKDEKIQKGFGERFLKKLESKVKKSQKKYDTFIKIISKPKKKKKSKQNTVSKKAIVEFTLETFGKTNKIWAKGFKQLIKEGKLSEEDGNNFLDSIDKSVKEYWEVYIKDMTTVISDSFGKKSNKKGADTPKKAFGSILGMINLARDSWKKKQQEQAKGNNKKQEEELKSSKKETTEGTEFSPIYEKRIQDLELKVSLLLQEIGIIKKMCQEKATQEVTPEKEAIAKKAVEKKIITAKVNPNTTATQEAAPAKKTIAKKAVVKKKITSTEENPNPEKDNFKKIEGIGPKIESLLHNAGIMNFKQLSSTKAEAIQAILTEAGNRFKMHKPTTWGQQAALAAKGNWEALKKWQDELKGEK